MEQIREYLKDIGFIRPNCIDSIDFENLVLKLGQDRMELIQWCLSELDETLKAKLLHIRDDELINELLTLTRELGLCSEDDWDTVLGLGERERQITFWLELLNIVKCAQQRNKLQAEWEFKTLPNTSNMWCELLESSKFQDFSSIKMNLIPIELRIGGQHKTGSLASTIVKEKDSLKQRLQETKDEEEGQDILDTAVLNNHSINISAADIKTDVEEIKELCTKLNLLYQDDLTSQPRQLQPLAQSQEAMTLENMIGQVHTFSQTAHFAEILVNGLETAMQWKDNSRDGNHENLTDEVFNCYKFLEKK